MDELQKNLVLEASENQKKRLSIRYVNPMMMVISLLFVVNYFEASPQKYAMLALCLFSSALNIYLGSKNRVFRIGKRKFESRSDTGDVIRWIYNIIVYDTLLFYVFETSHAVMAMLWTSLIVVAQADIFRRTYQRAISTLIVITGSTMLAFMFPETPLLEQILIIAMLGFMAFAWSKSDQLWIEEIKQKHLAQRGEIEAQERELSVIAETEKIKHDAMLGEKLRFITHEINNLMFVLEMARSGEFDEKRRASFLRAFEKLRGITSLVLSDLNGKGEYREVTAESLISDIALILEKRLLLDGVSLYLQTDASATGKVFTERKGSTFYILNNLVKNARDAVLSSTKPDKSVYVSAKFYKNLLVFEIEDKGCGMTQKQIDAILNSEVSTATTKETGHGIGMRFVRSECEKNGFVLDITSRIDHGTIMRLKIDPLRNIDADERKTA